MELQIFNAIAGGTLHPKFIKSPRGSDIPFGDLHRQLIRGTKDLKNIEASLLSVLEGYVKVATGASKTLHLEEEEATYSVQTYTYEVRYEAGIGEAKTGRQKFYKSLLEKESARITLSLREYAANAKNDFDARMQVLDTLENIIRVSERACQESGLIFKWLKLTLLKLYVEIWSNYYYLIPDEEMMTFIDLYHMLFQTFPSDGQLAAFMKTFLKGRIQQCIRSGETPSKKLRDDLYTILKTDPDEDLRRIALWLEYFILARRYGFDGSGLNEPQKQKEVLRRIGRKIISDTEAIPERAEKERKLGSELLKLGKSSIEESPFNILRGQLKAEYENIGKENGKSGSGDRVRTAGLCLRYDCTNDSIRDCYTSLLMKNLIDGNTPYMTFKKTFTGNLPETPINWTGTLPELTAFIKAVKSENLLVDTIGYWDKVALSFRHHDQPLTSRQLRSQHESENDRKATANAVSLLTQQSEL